MRLPVNIATVYVTRVALIIRCLQIRKVDGERVAFETCDNLRVSDLLLESFHVTQILEVSNVECDIHINISKD